MADTGLMAAAAQVINNRDEALQEALQYVPNMFEQEDYSIDQVRTSKIFMVNKDKTLPIHPEPNADHKVSMWLSEYHCVVANPEDTNPDNGLYIKTILPPGWMHTSCLDANSNEQILIEVEKQTFDIFYTNPNASGNGNEEQNCCVQKCAPLTECVKGVSLKIRKQPIYLIALFLFLHFLSECVIFADLITDIAVAVTLAQAHEAWLFMLTMVFVFAPYYIAWAAAFGYLQKKAMDSTAQAALTSQSSNVKNAAQNGDGDSPPTAERTPSKPVGNESDAEDAGEDENADSEKKPKKEKALSTTPDRKIQSLILVFSIAPIGVLLLMALDVYLLFEDLIIKPVALCLNKNSALREESLAEAGYKKLRRVSEVVAETLCQTVLQFFIYLQFNGDKDTKVNTNIVLLSLITSILVLFSWGVVLKIESQSFGLKFYEYVTVVLQGSFNFVPYLPAIERGKRTKVNWTNFKFDSHSVGLVSKALISPDCELTTIKLSGYSLSKLTRHECRFLGQMLADSPKNRVEVIFSRSRSEVQSLFERFDEDNSRTFDFREFLQLCCALRQSDDGLVSAEDVASIFKEIADSETREVYLTDLLLTINKSTEKLLVIDYDSPVMFALKESRIVPSGATGGAGSTVAQIDDAAALAAEEMELAESVKPNLLTFMIAAKVIDEDAFDIVTTDLVVSGKYGSAIMMCEDRGLPLVVEIISANNLDAHDADGFSDPYVNVSVSGQVKRTQTMPKNLNPYWGEALLFLIPPEDIPAMLSKDESVGLGQTVYASGQYAQGHHKKRRNSNFGHSHRVEHKTGDETGPAHAGSSELAGGLTKHGHIAHGPGRLEINIKVYDYDEEEDDDFMGSYKHFLKYTINDFKEHHDWETLDKTTNKPGPPKMYTHVLKNRNDEAGNLQFRVYCGAIGWYLNSNKNVNEAYAKELTQQHIEVKTA